MIYGITARPERLTGYDENGRVYALPTDSDRNAGVGKLRGNGVCDYAHIIERLAAYEDGEDDGRILRLPCREGDTIYAVYSLPCKRRCIIKSASNCSGCDGDCDLHMEVDEVSVPSQAWLAEEILRRLELGARYYLDRTEAEEYARRYNRRIEQNEE